MRLRAAIFLFALWITADCVAQPCPLLPTSRVKLYRINLPPALASNPDFRITHIFPRRKLALGEISILDRGITRVMGVALPRNKTEEGTYWTLAGSGSAGGIGTDGLFYFTKEGRAMSWSTATQSGTVLPARSGRGARIAHAQTPLAVVGWSPDTVSYPARCRSEYVPTPYPHQEIRCDTVETVMDYPVAWRDGKLQRLASTLHCAQVPVVGGCYGPPTLPVASAANLAGTVVGTQYKPYYNPQAPSGATSIVTWNAKGAQQTVASCPISLDNPQDAHCSAVDISSTGAIVGFAEGAMLLDGSPESRSFGAGIAINGTHMKLLYEKWEKCPRYQFCGYAYAPVMPVGISDADSTIFGRVALPTGGTKAVLARPEAQDLSVVRLDDRATNLSDFGPGATITDVISIDEATRSLLVNVESGGVSTRARAVPICVKTAAEY